MRYLITALLFFGFVTVSASAENSPDQDRPLCDAVHCAGTAGLGYGPAIAKTEKTGLRQLIMAARTAPPRPRQFVLANVWHQTVAAVAQR
jgi:hypothetical protein